MSNFIVSALKYRPTTFESVVGQPAITATLKNAIVQNQLAHAYLFCGPRGVGKTTCARILAKTLNCSNIQPGTEPCNACESCASFNENRSYNIHELDAASNNGVDDIRLLTEQVRIPPQLGRYSIYIIDEVHMLSLSAFNAFLKTLEEPPKHAIFILATTEKHKIIPTILSRCQIFDFNRIRVEDIIKHLQFVAQKENIEAENEALNVIALKADGAMRDALSIFDQVVSFSQGVLTYQKTIENLNVLDYDFYFQIVDAILENRAMDILLLFNTILENGFDAQYFLSGLATHLRDLLVSREQKTLVLLEVGDSVKEKYKNQALQTDPNLIFRALDILGECDINYRVSRNKRLHVELALLKLSALSKKKVDSTTTKEAIPEVTKPSAKPKERPTVTKTEKVQEEQKKEEKEQEEKTNNTPTKEEDTVKELPSVSISIRPSTKQEATIESPENKPDELIGGEDDFSNDNATEVIKDFTVAKHLDSRMKATFTTYPAVIQGKHTIAIKINNSLEEERARRIHKELELFCQKKLNNKHIKIEFIRPKEEDRSIHSMGSKEKLEFFIERNKNVLILKEKMGLQLD